MTSFSPAIAVFSFIASTVALVFIIIGIVKNGLWKEVHTIVQIVDIILKHRSEFYNGK